MATTFPVHGRQGYVQVNDGGDKKVGNITAWSYSETVEEVETTAMADGSASYYTGLVDGSGTVDFMVDHADTGQDAVWANLNGTGSTIELELWPEVTTGTGPYTPASGDDKLTGDVVIETISMNASVDGMITGSFSFRGALTKATGV
jgi:hypothetical protein